MSMKQFKVRDGKVKVDGVWYSQKYNEDIKIKGKVGIIQSINIGGHQFFPLSGVFDDGTIVVTDDNTGIVEEVVKPKKSKKTELVESNGKPLDENGKPIKRSKKSTK